jgi:DNA-binding CsgD family transcriptional regulator
VTDSRLPWSDPLTEKEIESLVGAAAGESTAETGRRLFVSPSAIKERRHQARIKLGARSTTEAVVLAIRYGILTPPGFDAAAAELRATEARIDVARAHLEAALDELEGAA